MVLNLNSTYRIVSDRYGWNLEEKHVSQDRKTGEINDVWSPQGFWPTFEQVLQAAYELQLRLDGARNLEDAIQAARMIINDIVKSLEFNPEVLKR